MFISKSFYEKNQNTQQELNQDVHYAEDQEVILGSLECVEYVLEKERLGVKYLE